MGERDAAEPDTWTRRQVLGGAALAALDSGRRLGCPARENSGEQSCSTHWTEPTPVGDRTTADDRPTVRSVSVVDFLEYAAAGVAQVYNRADTQYVVVNLDAGDRDVRTVREALQLTLGGPRVPQAAKQPDSRDGHVAVAFAVSKRRQFGDGVVRYADGVRHALDASTLDRLNGPSVFAVSSLDVSPSQLRAGERTTATVRLTVENTGTGRGAFGATLKGNDTSGTTLKVTLDAGEGRTVSERVAVVGRGASATVSVDWGDGVSRRQIPVVGGEQSTPCPVWG